MRSICLAAFVLATASWASSASAAGPWTQRKLTLPAGHAAFDVGLGLGHVPGDIGPGLNLELGVGIMRHVELGLRTGLRFGDAARWSWADGYGRLFETETYDLGGDTVANPELRGKVELVNGEVVELGAEGRMYLPFDDHLGILLGVPLAFHFGRDVRLDTGVYVPVIFRDDVDSGISIPAHLWFQLGPELWLGPLLGVRWLNNPDRAEVPLGFGLGYQVLRALDFKTELYFPDVTHDNSRFWGVGAGIQVRAE